MSRELNSFGAIGKALTSVMASAGRPLSLWTLWGGILGVGILGVASAGNASAQSLVTPATFDRWMYPFNTTPGLRTTGSVFGTPLNPMFDDRDAQILVGFPLVHADLPLGLPPRRYEILSARVFFTTAADGAFLLDRTSDQVGSYTGAAPDFDPGRPLELFGVGFRNGYVGAGFGGGSPGPVIFEETDPFGLPGPPAARIRHAFASDNAGGSPRDISNNVKDGIDLHPWAVGQVDNLADGAPVPINTPVEFLLDLGNSDVVDYLREGLSSGSLFFALTSMHPSTQGNSQGIPAFHLSHPTLGSGGPVPQLHLQWMIVPEPGASSLLGMGFAALLAIVRRR